LLPTPVFSKRAEEENETQKYHILLSNESLVAAAVLFSSGHNYHTSSSVVMENQTAVLGYCFWLCKALFWLADADMICVCLIKWLVDCQINQLCC
jgi:hypothetical protein